MSDHITPGMVEAASEHLPRPPHYSEALWEEDISEAIAAALAAAPTVSVFEGVCPSDHGTSHTVHADVWACGLGGDWEVTPVKDCRRCSGPHRTLLLGPVIEETTNE